MRTVSGGVRMHIWLSGSRACALKPPHSAVSLSVGHELIYPSQKLHIIGIY